VPSLYAMNSWCDFVIIRSAPMVQLVKCSPLESAGRGFDLGRGRWKFWDDTISRVAALLDESLKPG
jgi:hypothetical protein